MVGANWRWATLGHVNMVNCVVGGWWLPRGTPTIGKSNTRKTQKKGQKKAMKSPPSSISHLRPTECKWLNA